MADLRRLSDAEKTAWLNYDPGREITANMSAAKVCGALTHAFYAGWQAHVNHVRATLEAGEEWQDIAEIEDEPATDATKVFHALLWGRLHVRAGDRAWTTEWKILKAAWVYWNGTGINGSAKRADNWFVGGEGNCRIERIEATHWRPLPAPPALNLEADR